MTIYASYDGSDKVHELVKEGIKLGLVMPQYHSTEHININNWMLSLQQGDKATLKAFHYGMANLHKEAQSNCPKEHLDALGYREQENIESLEDSL